MHQACYCGNSLFLFLQIQPRIYFSSARISLYVNNNSFICYLVISVTLLLILWIAVNDDDDVDVVVVVGSLDRSNMIAS